MDIGIRDLKQRLSEFLERAARGEIIRITDRGEPKALLTPLPGRTALERGVAEGWIRAAHTGQRAMPPERFPSVASTAQALDDDRGT